MNQPRVLSIFDLDPFRVGSNEAFARELSRQLGQLGWESILCFIADPPRGVREFLQLPNVSFDVLKNPCHVGVHPLRDLARVLGRWRPSIVHCHYTGFVGPCPWLAKLSGSHKVFFTDHTSREAGYVPAPAAAWKRAATRIINLPLTGVICVSDYGYQCFASAGLLPARRVRRIYNGVDVSLFGQTETSAREFRARHAIPEKRSVVLQVSWIRPEKGIPEMLDAARIVHDRNSEAHFVIAGEGADRENFTRQAAGMGLGGHITWTGLVQNPFAEGLFAAADVVCQPSRWEEVFGWVITEAMAAGKPVVATRVGGIPEIVGDGETGFLVPRGDSNALATRILTLLGDPALRTRMGQAGRLKVEEKFDLRKNVAELVDWYGVA